MDNQKFSRTVELDVQGTIGVQTRVPFPQKGFFGTQFNWHIFEFIKTWNKVSLKIGKFWSFVITISIESFPSTKIDAYKKNSYKCL